VNRYDDPRWYEEQFPDPSPARQDPSYPLDSFNVPSQHGNFSRASMEPAPPSFRPRQRKRRGTGQIIVVAALIVIAFAGGWFANQYYTYGLFTPSSQSKMYEQLFQQAWGIVDQHYVDRSSVNYKQMAYSAIQAMVDSLHDTGHTRFLTPNQVQSENQQLSGTFTGIGIYLNQDPKTKQFIITAPIPGSPAEKAGLRHGDILIAVNGISTVGKDINGVSSLIQGKAGTSVTITIKRPGTQQTLTFHIVRAEITVPNVVMHYISQDHIADIQILQFADSVSSQLEDALKKAKDEGANKIILDLRDNPGGYLSEAVDTASEFIKSGDVLLEQNSQGQRTPVAVNGHPIDTTSPMVVLVNHQTASAAEIVSGALQDNKRAEIIGMTTFGTGTVLEQFNLSDGSAILLGTQEWLTPDAQFIRNKGITPNLEVPLSDNVPPLTPTVENASNMSEQQILHSNDTQLIAAIKYLLAH
jgi:carboxyl-terminal processing protease